MITLTVPESKQSRRTAHQPSPPGTASRGPGGGAAIKPRPDGTTSHHGSHGFAAKPPPPASAGCGKRWPYEQLTLVNSLASSHVEFARECRRAENHGYDNISPRSLGSGPVQEVVAAAAETERAAGRHAGGQCAILKSPQCSLREIATADILTGGRSRSAWVRPHEVGVSEAAESHGIA